MEKNNQVVFRRIKGRIIPIRRKDDANIDARKAIGGAALAGAGAATAILAGKKAFSFLRKAADVENRAFAINKMISRTGQMGLFSRARLAAPGKLLSLSSKLNKSRNFALLGGAAAGGALITAGARVLSKDKELAKDKNIQKFTTIAGGFGAGALLANLAYRRRVNPVESISKAIQYAKSRKTIQYILKGI